MQAAARIFIAVCELLIFAVDTAAVCTYVVWLCVLNAQFGRRFALPDYSATGPVPESWIPTLPLYRVHWWDAVAITGWRELSEAEALRPHLICTTGHLVKECSDCLVISLSVGVDSDIDIRIECNAVMVIPRGCIANVEKLSG